MAVGRNAYAHGSRRIDPSGANRLRDICRTNAREGDLVVLDYPTLKVFRGRLRALMSLCGVGWEEC